MQSNDRYSMPPDMQPFPGSRGTFGSISMPQQTRSTVHPHAGFAQPHHQGLFHQSAEHNQHAHAHQHLGQNPQHPPWEQPSEFQHPHYLHPQSSHHEFFQHPRPQSHSAGLSAHLATGPPPRQLILATGTALGHNGVHDDGHMAIGLDTRWTTEETTSLLAIRSEVEASFGEAGFIKGPLWEEVSRQLQELGYNRSARKCKEQYEYVQKYYINTKETKGARQADVKNYRFFSEVEAIPAGNNTNNDSGTTGGSSSGRLGAFSTAKGRGGEASMENRENTCNNAVDLSDYSEDEHVLSEDIDEQLSTKKRKRRSRSSPSRILFQKFAKKILEQQEALHDKFLETLEKRDRERQIRDEDYKRQETARLNREQEIRAQELASAAARDAALIAFLENVTSHPLQLPKVTPLTSNLANVSEVPEEKGKDLSDSNTKRWPKVEVHALIRLRSGMEPRFQEAGPKAHLWQEISTAMACMGFSRSPKRCKEKWENINKYFKKTKDSCRKRPENAKTCPYFHQLDTLYRRGILGSPINKGNRVGNQSENFLDENRETTTSIQDRNAETMAIIPVRENGPDSDQATTSTAVRLHSERENSTEAGRIASQSQGFSDPYAKKASGLTSQMDRSHGDGTSISKNSMQVEIFVKDILEMQQQQQQKMVDEYDRMEHARELRELERQQKQGTVPLVSQTSAHDNAALMSLVHKFGEDSADLSMTAPASMD